jgi:DNA-binding beta-propeller fold protein YncE
MLNKNKKVYIFILVAFTIIVSLFLYEELFYNLMTIEPVVTYENLKIINPKSSGDQLADTSQLDTIMQEKETPQIKITSEVVDPSGQLVHHLFNINSVPSPKAAVFSPDNKEIWVTMLLNAKRGVAVFDVQTGEKIKDINLSDGGGVEIIFSSDGNLVYVSQMETATVFEIDAKTKNVLRTFNAKSTWTKALEFSADGNALFASNWVGNDISEIDLQSGRLIRTIPTVKIPRGIYATKDGNYLYVAGFDNGEIQKIDLKTGQGKIIYKSEGAMRHIVADEERGVLFVSDMGKNVILQVSLADDSVKEFAITDINPNTIVLSPDKKILFVSCRGINYSDENYPIPGPEWGSVLLFDAETGKMLDAIVGGNQPTALAVSPDGKKLVFSDFLDSRLEIFEIPSYSVLANGNGGRSDVYKAELKK